MQYAKGYFMYYIYELWNKQKNEPIYVGYGKHNRQGGPRYECHIREAISFREGKINKTNKLNMYKINVILQILDSNDGIDYKFPYINLTYKEACDLEIQLIEKYGRRCLGTGTLTNIDPGGRGGRILTEETKKKMSKAKKGKESKLKGKNLGTYPQERKDSIKEGIKRYLETKDGKEKRKAIGQKLKGRSAWNKGKTRDNDLRVAKYSDAKIGISRPDLIGNTPWNKGQTKETNNKIKETSEKLKGRTIWNKGKMSPNKGKSYEEMYGKEVAQKMKDSRRNTAWINNKIENKKIKLEDFSLWESKGWVRGRLFLK